MLWLMVVICPALRDLSEQELFTSSLVVDMFTTTCTGNPLEDRLLCGSSHGAVLVPGCFQTERSNHERDHPQSVSHARRERCLQRSPGPLPGHASADAAKRRTARRLARTPKAAESEEPGQLLGCGPEIGLCRPHPGSKRPTRFHRKGMGHVQGAHRPDRCR